MEESRRRYRDRYEGVGGRDEVDGYRLLRQDDVTTNRPS